MPHLAPSAGLAPTQWRRWKPVSQCSHWAHYLHPTPTLTHATDPVVPSGVPLCPLPLLLAQVITKPSNQSTSPIRSLTIKTGGHCSKLVEVVHLRATWVLTPISTWNFRKTYQFWPWSGLWGQLHYPNFRPYLMTGFWTPTEIYPNPHL